MFRSQHLPQKLPEEFLKAKSNALELLSLEIDKKF